MTGTWSCGRNSW